MPKYITLVLAAMLLISGCRAETPKPDKEQPEATDSGSAVFFTKRITPEAVREIYSYLENKPSGKIAIKVHFGEEGNRNFLPASLIEGLCGDLNATLVETNVLYGGTRGKTDSHIALARRHGFTFAPIDILDASGNLAYDCELPHFSKVYTGSHFEDYDGYLIFSHFKGHGQAGFGGAIKNISMGLASKEGKRFLHRGNYPVYDQSKCIDCGLCVRACPESAITLDPVNIDHLDCTACGKCIATCPVGVFQTPPRGQDGFLERLVEYTKVLTEKKPMVYINVLANISSVCDCFSNAPRPFLPDIGILASTDLVAIEKASHDLVDKAHNCDDAFLKEISVSGKRQISYAAELGLGSTEYRLIDIDR
ncbi:MAG: DUF362 domain-containing protein [Candidatus Syntrophosphaera sp.]|nr:DUF362 domain-containing protein [Candidatus Syntrophosphaera sp.]